MIIVCAFLPLFTMTGPAGALFGPMANTYAFSILGALLLAVTLAPVLCSFLFRNKREEKDTLVDRVMKRVFLRILDWVLDHRWLTLAVMAGLLAFTVALLPGLGAEFMPELEEGNLWIRAQMPRTVSLEEAARMAPRLREVIASVPEVRGVMSHVGRPDDGTDVTSFFNLEFNVPAEAGRRVAPRAHPREDRGRAEREVPRLPRPELQLLAAHPRQRRGGPLGGQGGQLGQALRRRPGHPGGGRPAGRRRPADGPGDRERGPVPHRRPAQPGDPHRPPGLRPLRHQRGRRRGGRPGRHRRPGLHPDGRGGEALRHRPAAARGPPRRPDLIARIPVDVPGSEAGRGTHPALAAGTHRPAQARRLVHLPREQPPLHPDQVQRPGPRPGLGHRRGPAQGRGPADRGQAAEGLPDRVVGRVRPDAGGQRPALGSCRCRSS